MLKDLKTKPTKGCHFPIEFNEAAHLLREQKINMVYSNDRIKIRLRNLCEGQENPLILMRFYPKEFLAIYSIPDEYIERVKKEYVIFGIKQLEKFKDKRIYSRLKDYYYEIDFDLKLNEIHLLKKVVHLKMTFEYNNRPQNRATYKITKRDIEIISKTRFQK